MKDCRIDRIPMTANAYGRSHWRVQRREVKHWRAAIHEQVGRAPAGWARKRRRVIVTVFRPRRLQDPDNAAQGLKAILDALVGLGWLFDDTAEAVRSSLSEELAERGERGRTFITLW